MDFAVPYGKLLNGSSAILSVPLTAGLWPNCVTCNDVNHFDRHVSISGLRTTAVNCQLCDLLLQAIQRVNKSDLDDFHICREGSALNMGAGGPRILRLCSDIGICYLFASV
jgi:hypothetical protein